MIFVMNLKPASQCFQTLKLRLPLVKPGGTEVSVQKELTFVMSYIIHELDISKSCMVRTRDIMPTT